MDHDIHNLPAKMVAEIAMGVTDPLTIARNHGFSDAEFYRLAANPYYYGIIEKKKKELGVDGLTTKVKMAHLAEELLHDAYVAAKASDSVMHKLDVAKYLSKLGGLEPQPGATTIAGGGFNISINFTHSQDQKPVTIEGTAAEAVVSEEGMWPENLSKRATPTLNILNDNASSGLPAYFAQLMAPPDVANSDLTDNTPEEPL